MEKTNVPAGQGSMSGADENNNTESGRTLRDSRREELLEELFVDEPEEASGDAGAGPEGGGTVRSKPASERAEDADDEDTDDEDDEEARQDEELTGKEQKYMRAFDALKDVFKALAFRE